MAYYDIVAMWPKTVRVGFRPHAMQDVRWFYFLCKPHATVLTNGGLGLMPVKNLIDAAAAQCPTINK